MVEYTYTEYTPTTHRRRFYFVHLDPSRRPFIVCVYIRNVMIISREHH